MNKCGCALTADGKMIVCPNHYSALIQNSVLRAIRENKNDK